MDFWNPEQRSLTTYEAVVTVVSEHKIRSMYALANILSNESITVQPIQISNYLNKGTKMSKKVALRFLEVFNIDVTDAKGTLIRSFYETCDQGLTRLKSR